MLSHSPPPQQKQVFKRGRKRNQGWEPLKYPVAALLDQQPYEDEDCGESVAAIPSSTFPLHTDVILAAIRELLILNGCLDSKTLTVNDTALVRTIMGMPLKEQQEYQQLCDHDIVENSKKRKRDLAVVSPFEATKPEVNGLFIQDTVTGEEVAYAVLFQVIAAGCSSSMSDKKGSDDVNTTNHRAMSVDIEDSTAWTEEKKDDSFEWTHHTTADEQPIPKMRQLLVNIIQDSASNCSENGMVQLSILDEAVFRKGAVQMAKALTASFSDRSVSLFLGYKGSKNLRDREEAMLGEFLFDTSHAMFAFEHTQEDMLANESGVFDMPSKRIDQYHEMAKVVLESLLGEDRSIQKVGDLSDESLLLHAISIAHDCRSNDSWTHFATINRGQKMLAHHENAKAVLMAGSKRRGGRSRLPRSPVPNNGDEDDSVSHSISDDTFSLQMTTTTVTPEKIWEIETEKAQGGKSPGNGSQFESILDRTPGAKGITITKQHDRLSWGLHFTKEGEACVVDLVRYHVGTGQDNLERGDMILFAENRDGRNAFSPSISFIPNGTTEHQFNSGEEYFRELVDLFKTSSDLNLIVRRAF